MIAIASNGHAREEQDRRGKSCKKRPAGFRPRRPWLFHVRSVVVRLVGHEFLRALAGVDFGGIAVALRIHCQVVHPVELAGVTAVATKCSYENPIAALEDRHDVVVAIGPFNYGVRPDDLTARQFGYGRVTLCRMSMHALFNLTMFGLMLHVPRS